MKYKKKHFCSFCNGQPLSKGKELVNLEDIAENDIAYVKGELHSSFYDKSESLIYEIKFKINYCPICGRKIKNKVNINLNKNKNIKLG